MQSPPAPTATSWNVVKKTITDRQIMVENDTPAIRILRNIIGTLINALYHYLYILLYRS